MKKIFKLTKEIILFPFNVITVILFVVYSIMDRLFKYVILPLIVAIVNFNEWVESDDKNNDEGGLYG